MRRPSRHDDILAIYYKYGGAISVPRLARYCWDEGVWGPEEQRSMAEAAARRECQNAISRKGPTGLPLAGPTTTKDGSSRVWRQLDLWDYNDAVYNLGMRIKQTVVRDWATIEAIQSYMQSRWGQAPPIPRWELDDGAPMWWEDLDDDGEDDA